MKAKTQARPNAVPPLCVHKGSGQAYVNIGGVRKYLGRHDAPGTTQRYARFVAEMAANNGMLPISADDLTINELVARFLVHARTYYVDADGQPTCEVANFNVPLTALCGLFGDEPVTAFGPRALKTLRQQFIDRKWSRTTVNKTIGKIRRVIRWGVAEELIAPSSLHALSAVSGLKRGRCGARESQPVRPVPDHVVDATIKVLTPPLAAMVELQRLTGMRSGELVIMRTCDLNTEGRIWTYRPCKHKTEHHGHQRIVYIGPAAQQVLKPWLRSDLQGYIFSPKESEAVRRAAMHDNRKTPPSCGNGIGTNRKLKPAKSPGDRYTTESFQRTIKYACARAFPAPEGMEGDELKQWRREHSWHPHQLRHSFASRVRREAGLDAAQALLGHRSASITEVYAELDHEKAVNVIARVG